MVPSFNPSKKSLGTGTIAVHGVGRLTDGVFVNPNILSAGRIDDPLQARDQVFCSRHHKNIAVVVLRKTLLCFAGDAWDRELPAQSERPIAISGAVLQGEGWPEAITA